MVYNPHSFSFHADDDKPAPVKLHIHILTFVATLFVMSLPFLMTLAFVAMGVK